MAKLIFKLPQGLFLTLCFIILCGFSIFLNIHYYLLFCYIYMPIEFSRKTHTYRFVLTYDQLPTWRKCKVFKGGNCHILNVQFGLHLSSLKMVSFNIGCYILIFMLIFTSLYQSPIELLTFFI
jgi:hypothetical protein